MIAFVDSITSVMIDILLIRALFSSALTVIFMISVRTLRAENLKPITEILCKHIFKDRFPELLVVLLPRRSPASGRRATQTYP